MSPSSGPADTSTPQLRAAPSPSQLLSPSGPFRPSRPFSFLSPSSPSPPPTPSPARLLSCEVKRKDFARVFIKSPPLWGIANKIKECATPATSAEITSRVLNGPRGRGTFPDRILPLPGEPGLSQGLAAPAPPLSAGRCCRACPGNPAGLCAKAARTRSLRARKPLACDAASADLRVRPRGSPRGPPGRRSL